MAETDLLTVARRVLTFEMTIAEWIGLGLMVLAPYGVIGLIWAFTHLHDLEGAHGIGWVLLFIRAVIAWPVLLGENLCVA